MYYNLRLVKTNLRGGHMSAEIIQLVCSMNLKNINTQIALQCSPLLTGIKISNLLITNCENEYLVKQLFENTSLSVEMIYKSDKRITFLIFQEDKLIDYLNGIEETALFNILGYNAMKLHEIFAEFSKRFTRYMEKREDFPHEMGLFLEYPVEDVIGFIENQGKKFLYTGYWKVYGNLQKALETFDRYNSAKENIIQLLAQGVSIEGILTIYHLKNNQLVI